MAIALMTAASGGGSEGGEGGREGGMEGGREEENERWVSRKWFHQDNAVAMATHQSGGT